MENPSDSEEMSRGTEAYNLLNTPAFASVIKSIRNDAISAIIATQIKDRNVREDMYLIIRAADTIVETLHQRVQTRDTLLEAREAERTQDDTEQ